MNIGRWDRNPNDKFEDLDFQRNNKKPFFPSWLLLIIGLCLGCAVVLTGKMDKGNIKDTYFLLFSVSVLIFFIALVNILVNRHGKLSFKCNLLGLILGFAFLFIMFMSPISVVIDSQVERDTAVVMNKRTDELSSDIGIKAATVNLEKKKAEEHTEQIKSSTPIVELSVNNPTNTPPVELKEDIIVEEVPHKVFDVVEEMPSFPGGNSALMSFLQSNVDYPVVAQNNGVQGRVQIGFVVEPDGSLSGVKVVRSVEPSLDKEAMRVVRSMPRWDPGKQNGQAVRVKYTVPVLFRLQ